MSSKYSLRSFAILWTVLFISSFLVFLYIILNLFFSEHITNSSLKDLKYSAHIAKLKLTEEKELLKNTLALHISSPEFIEALGARELSTAANLISNWSALHKNLSIELYSIEGSLLDLKRGEVSKEEVSLSSFAKSQLDLGYEQVEHLTKEDKLIISVQRKIFSKANGNLGYLVERKSYPYPYFLENNQRSLIVKNKEGVIYVTPDFEAAKNLSERAFEQGASAFELSLNSKAYDVIRVDVTKSLSFFIARENLRGIVFRSFYTKYFVYFLIFLLILSVVFYISYYKQVFKPLAQLSDSILNENTDKIQIDSSLKEISVISKKLSKRISNLNTDIEANKVGRVNDVARLVSSVAHELNNSLSYLGGNISYLKDELSSGDELDIPDIMESLESAESGYQRIKNIVSDLKVFSAETSLSIAWVSVEDIFLKLQKEFSDVEFSFSDNLNGLEVETDKDRVAQIIRNLIQNAQQAYGEETDKKILLAFFMNGDQLLISVKDWAGGVAPEVAKNIFEPFFTTKKTVGGAGLGLSVSQNLSREIGGDLMLQSTSSEGSVFCLILKRFRSKV